MRPSCSDTSNEGAVGACTRRGRIPHTVPCRPRCDGVSRVRRRSRPHAEPRAGGVIEDDRLEHRGRAGQVDAVAAAQIAHSDPSSGSSRRRSQVRRQERRRKGERYVVHGPETVKHVDHRLVVEAQRHPHGRCRVLVFGPQQTGRGPPTSRDTSSEKLPMWKRTRGSATKVPRGGLR